MVDLKPSSDEPMDDIMGDEPGFNVRWPTEEDLTEGAALQRKTQSLADFTQGKIINKKKKTIKQFFFIPY